MHLKYKETKQIKPKTLWYQYRFNSLTVSHLVKKNSQAFHPSRHFPNSNNHPDAKAICFIQLVTLHIGMEEFRH